MIEQNIFRAKAVAMVLLLMVFASAQAQGKELKVSDIDGKMVDVKDYIGDGRWAIVMLWQLDCIPCEQQKPAVEAFHDKYKSSSAHVIGLVIDGHDYMDEIRSFVKKKPTAFPSHVVFSDVFTEQITEETGKDFPAAPGYIIYGPKGELVKALNSRVNINDLLSYVEDKFDS